MKGALYGDHIAWTYEHEPDVYATNLISPHACDSLHGFVLHSLMGVQKLEDPCITFRTCIVHNIELFVDAHGLVPPSIHEYLDTGYKIIPKELKDWTWPAAYIHSGFLADSEDAAIAQALKWQHQLHIGKVAYYTAHLSPLLYRLRHGATVKEIESDTSFIGYSIHHNSLLGKYWNCLVNSIDYKSALDNAMHAPGYRHLNGIVVGALAEAYYKDIKL